MARFNRATQQRRVRAAIFLALSIITSVNASERCSLCPRDVHGRIARSTHSKAEFRHANPCPSTGLTRSRCPGYIIDHIIPLKRGGPDAPANMQWQTIQDAKAKDRTE